MLANCFFCLKPAMIKESDTGVTLLIIDAQNDFHPELDAVRPMGSLAVSGANEDAQRIAKFIEKSLQDDNNFTIDRIVATLDSHQKLHIAHPKFWTDAKGNNPSPFTLIKSDDVKDGTWIPRGDLKLPRGTLEAKYYTKNEQESFNLVEYCTWYCKRLEGSKIPLCIWPEHCLIGSEGHGIVKEIRSAIDKWSEKTGQSPEFIQKGENLLTEMYSVMKAEVPITEETSFNQKLFLSLNESSAIYVCGQALSHCVNYSVMDILGQMNATDCSKVHILKDCCSSVTGFEKQGDDFLVNATGKGVVIVEDSSKI